MKKVLILFIALISITSNAQSQYETGMQKAFDLWQANKQWEAANLFERIANAEPDNWLPPYYAAQINILYSFGEKDIEKLNAQLAKAQDFINQATLISKDNPELMTLQAMWYTAWIIYDGQQYGMKYSAQATELYQKALTIAPNNPRIILSKAEWDIGGAQYFGQSIEPYCKDIKRAIELFPTFKPEQKFYPTEGLDRAQELLAKSCK